MLSAAGPVVTAAALGCLLGLRHASDPDHVAAVSAIVARERGARAAARVGAVWGLGHGAMVVAAGAVLLAFRLAVPPALAAGLELAVAVVLVGLGAANLRAAGRAHPHRAAAEAPERGLRRTFAVGILHGLAGSAAVALLAVAAMPTVTAGLVYLAVFALGTTAGMVGFSVGLGIPCARLATRPTGRRWLLAGSGALALGIGLHLAWGLGAGAGVL